MRFEEAGRFREVRHVELERGVFSIGTVRDLGEFLRAPQSDLPPETSMTVQTGLPFPTT